MKHLRKLASLLLAMVMIFSLAITAFAEKIEITPPTNTPNDVTNTYKIYKVFDATVTEDGITYALVNGKENAPEGFNVIDGHVTYAGGTEVEELTPEDIAAIAAYVTENDLVDTVTSNGTSHAVSEDLDPGYYYITTSTGTVVTINTTTKGTTTVNDKNTIPTLDKKITSANSIDEDGKKALAQIGTEVEYTVTITVGKGAKNYVFHDKMGSGLNLKADSVTVDGVTTKQYSIYAPGDDDDTLTIEFKDGIAEGTKITITYKATITESAVTGDPEKNTAYISYGDGNKTTHKETEVYNAQFSVNKKDSEGNALAGAGFVIMNAEKMYYKLENQSVTWVSDINDAEEHISSNDGKVQAFTGLANGTYKLVEKTVPAGYNKAADTSFTIAEHDYTAQNLKQAADVTNHAGAELPSTGGMGTTLFYALGGILVVAAVVLLVTKKRMSSAE